MSQDTSDDSDGGGDMRIVIDNDDSKQQYDNNSGRHRVVKKKGRGHRNDDGDDGRYGGNYDALPDRNDDNDGDDDTTAQRSVEGWIVIATGIHEEAQENDVYDVFADYGKPLQHHLNLDRRTGYVKGYALIEYATYDEASEAVENLNGTELLGQQIRVEFAFRKPQRHHRNHNRR